ncbi:MAG: asparagine--tRNA ligase, partial [Clostridia bacterium]|nr:asparagine--tRNA ligase [Clostridia bacterium]
MKDTSSKYLYSHYQYLDNKKVQISGWAKTIRDSKNIGFVELNDGFFKSVQIVLQKENLVNFDEIIKQNVGASFTIQGNVVITPSNQQPFEINATSVEIVGECATDYPLQKKRHSFEFLRENAYLRARTNTFNAVFRVRSTAAFLIHQFFNENDFVYLNTPLITSSDCEGAGAMFQVTTLELDKLGKNEKIDYTKDFFGKKTFLTVSGQLNEECFTHAFKNTYTFGPTFRAEKSNTARHAAEFWMMEPEMCFTDINGLMDNEEKMLKYVVSGILERCKDEIEFLNKFVDNDLTKRLNSIIKNDFVRLDYTEAITILEKVKDKFEYPVYWGVDLQSEHERYLTETVYKKPVFLMNYPKEIKAFYMKLNEDNKTVAAVDLLVPGIGELMGGSQREENYELLKQRIKDCGLDEKEYEAYLNLRRYGTCVHSGYGLGFERLIMYITGISNIRDVCL